jgi:hypothetical protein
MDDGQLGNQRPNENGRSQLGLPEISRSHFLNLCVQRQAAAVRMFLGFFRLGILALEIGERYVQRLVPEANSDGVHRNAFFVERVGVGLAEAVKLGALDAGFLRNRLQLAQEVPIRFAFTVGKH